MVVWYVAMNMGMVMNMNMNLIVRHKAFRPAWSRCLWWWLPEIQYYEIYCSVIYEVEYLSI